MKSTIKRRAGIGTVIILVCMALALIAAMGFGQTALSSHVISSVQRASFGITTQYIAEAACQEAVSVIERSVNDPSHSAGCFSQFRGEDSGSFEVSAINADALAKTKEIIESYDPDARYGLEEVRAKVLFRHPENYFEDEISGTIKISSLSKTGLVRNVQRRVEEYRDFRMGLVSAPYPFGGYVVYLGSAKNVLPDDANKYIGALFQRSQGVVQMAQALQSLIKTAEDGKMKQAFLAEVGKAIGALQPIAPLCSGQPGPSVPHIFGDPQGTGQGAIGSMDDMALAIHPSKTEGRDGLPFQIFEISPVLQMGHQRFDGASSMVLGAYQRAMQSARSKKGLDGGAVSAFSSACAQYAQAAQKLAGAYFFVQDLCTEFTGAALVEQREMFIARLAAKEWPKRSFYRVKDMSEFQKLLGTCESLSGIVFVESSTERLDWTSLCPRPFKGKLVVVHEGDVTLNNATVQDPTLDNLTFICCGSSVALGGTVQASVVLGLRDSNPPRLDTSSLQVLSGNIVSAQHIDFAPGTLKGLVKYDPTINAIDQSGQRKPNHFFVAIAPPLRAKEVLRK